MPKRELRWPILSLVFPLYNEELSVALLGKKLRALAPKLPKNTEVILVDDGSTDHTLAALQKLKLPFPKIIVQFSRNFGHQSALLAGLEHSRGEFVVTLDGDLQHPPELIPQMLAAHRKGIDIVLTKRIDGETTSQFKKWTARSFYALINLISETPIRYSASDFRSMSRVAVESLLSLDERQKFLRGMVEWIGFSTLVIPFQVQARQFGQSKYSLLKMIKLALHGITAFSVIPLYLSGVCSVFLFSLAALYAMYVLYVRFFTGSSVSGWASLLFVNLVIGGLTLLFLGLIGVYVAAIYVEVKKRPSYIVKSSTTQKASRSA